MPGSIPVISCYILPGSLDGVQRVMKEPLTLDSEAALGPESETREELIWKINNLEEHVKQLTDEKQVRQPLHSL